jgi:hypothetical protein
MTDGAHTMVWLGSGSAAGSLGLLLEGQPLGRIFYKECVWLIVDEKGCWTSGSLEGVD